MQRAYWVTSSNLCKLRSHPKKCFSFSYQFLLSELVLNKCTVKLGAGTWFCLRDAIHWWTRTVPLGVMVMRDPRKQENGPGISSGMRCFKLPPNYLLSREQHTESHTMPLSFLNEGLGSLKYSSTIGNSPATLCWEWKNFKQQKIKFTHIYWHWVNRKGKMQCNQLFSLLALDAGSIILNCCCWKAN